MRTTPLVALVALLAGPGPACAQSLSLGFRGGVGITKLTSDGPVDPDSRTTLTVGAFLHVPVGRVFSVEPGISYAQKGARYALGEEGEATLELSYVELPILVRFDLPSEGSVVAHLEAGPSVGFKSSCSFAVEEGGTSRDVECGQPLIEGEEAVDTKSSDIGALLGAGLTFTAGDRAAVGVDLFWDAGMVNINQGASGDHARNRALLITAAVSFPIG